MFEICRYPSLGTRFVHTSEGRLLVNRLVPCLKCASNARDLDTSCKIEKNDDIMW